MDSKLIAKLAIANSIANYIRAEHLDTGRVVKIPDAIKTLLKSDEMERLVYEELISRFPVKEIAVINP